MKVKILAEYFDVLDNTGAKIGRIKSRDEVHRDGDWHKGVYVWIVNDASEILLQKRAPDKDSDPDMWDVSSGGHLTAGDDSSDAAVREVWEELGVRIDKDQLRFLGTLKCPSANASDFIDNEFDDVYLARMSPDIGKMKLQAEEVSDAKYVSLAELKNMIAAEEPNLVMRPDVFRMLFDVLDRA
ncbi:MAG: NUDIX domain-containing protein [Rickettsiales bacterium]|jgi:isopentenyldiphosphate isomerase|nr:NUDIX domain-containing protein [Rickettsiales bacterium]